MTIDAQSWLRKQLDEASPDLLRETGCVQECWTYTSTRSWRFSPTPGSS